MSAAPVVSVALATYNGGRFVDEQVRSILEQDPPPAEIVVADDGSTDDTVAIVRRVAAEHPGVRLKVLESVGASLGVAGNFARAIAAASGDLVALSDQDDRWHEGRLAALIGRFVSDETLTLVHHDAVLVDGAGAPLGQRLLDWLRASASERSSLVAGNALPVYLRRNLATGATVVFRRELAERALPVGAGWIHDEWLAMIAAAFGGARLDERALIDYRQHGGNQIGVAKPTPAHLVRRMLEPRGDRYEWLAARTEALLEKLQALDAPADALTLVRAKLEFEQSRARYPRRRLARLGPVLAQRKSYRELSSQGGLDILRDLLHGA
ncbi:glycosyltransferase involved in cell wall biosynthesis [Microbacteriaceae bacterium SG_E_30_P1]|uniref:Glycosyltransferase involved in cell wall biosynthesis n=1 Tax=Antiquaquibacter oligotrophicus TaxID=2880260 RepID=A0ABT6KNY2_9MICO|nr:glycosyltransferase family 2 protein [Antiquaquibacter oligotrophicus]MDH6181717.1 glycosyltransferase involved in cell wall biosynthesis [Antiquaquibacter oligotrophicus]UDF12600.1 glycosyltransferase family 2 protein [Antiquaquibacter oligotrophicus]